MSPHETQGNFSWVGRYSAETYPQVRQVWRCCGVQGDLFSSGAFSLGVQDRQAPDESVDTKSVAKPPLFRPVVDGWVLPAGYLATYAARAQNDVWYLAGNDLDESGAVPETAFDY